MIVTLLLRFGICYLSVQYDLESSLTEKRDFVAVPLVFDVIL